MLKNSFQQYQLTFRDSLSGSNFSLSNRDSGSNFLICPCLAISRLQTCIEVFSSSSTLIMIIIFRPQFIAHGRKIIIFVAFFFLEICQISTISMLVAFSANCFLSYDGSVGSASAYQSVESGFDSRLRIFFDKAENIPVVSGRAGVLLLLIPCG